MLYRIELKVLTVVTACCLVAMGCTSVHRHGHSDEAKIRDVIADFCAAIEANDIEYLLQTSPLVRRVERRGDLEENMVRARAQSLSNKSKGTDYTKVIRVDIDDTVGDALAFITGPEKEKHPFWYYLRKEDNDWTIWIMENWPATPIADLFAHCREVIVLDGTFSNEATR